MKEKIYTIPLNDAVNENDECPFCFLERKLEQNMLDFVLGNSSSYMESDIRDKTDAAGFCRLHTKKMFDYGNSLGNSMILQTHMKKVKAELLQQMRSYQPPAKQSVFAKIRGKKNDTEEAKSSLRIWTDKRQSSCYICDSLKDEFANYVDTFFSMYKKDAGFRERVLKSKGFCLPHFADLMDMAEEQLKDSQKEEFRQAMFRQMEENYTRVEEDLDWLIDKYDYRNKDADWKNSRDALQRSMQKMHGGYPADPPYQHS